MSSGSRTSPWQTGQRPIGAERRAWRPMRVSKPSGETIATSAREGCVPVVPLHAVLGREHASGELGFVQQFEGTGRFVPAGFGVSQKQEDVERGGAIGVDSQLVLLHEAQHL